MDAHFLLLFQKELQKNEKIYKNLSAPALPLNSSATTDVYTMRAAPGKN
jgi:hypothetical protein